MQQADILIVEDDTSHAASICDTLEIAGYSALSISSGAKALDEISKQSFGMVISDVQMNQMDGLALLSEIKSQNPRLPVLLMTANGTIERAVEAMQAGAADYLLKPFQPEILIRQVKQNLISPRCIPSDCIVADRKMTNLYDLACRVSKSDVAVLIQGESGTGKEVIARYIHQTSRRQAQPFVAINCAAIPENMLEATLFGYEKGAFTGAHQSTLGKFELAQKGSLLLDEISEMDLRLQAKILRVLQEKEVERLGGRRTINLDVRVIATTNLNLKEQVAKGSFREDLFYRINVFPLSVPPLRQRRSDILPLADGFIRKYADYTKSLPQFDDDAAEVMLKYDWPGNVRELENVVQRALIMQKSAKIIANDIVFEGFGSVELEKGFSTFESEDSKLDQNLRSMEEHIIVKTLSEEKGSRKATAQRLGISPRTLRYKIARMRDAGIVLPG